MSKKIDYHQSVNYSQADPAKILAQKEGRATAKNLPFGFKELSGSRGESAYVFKMDDGFGALVQEGLGTKSLIAQSVYLATGQSYFGNIAIDSVACIINDLISVGATPVVLNAYWSSSSYSWLTEQPLASDLIKGWRQACDLAEVTWGGGETQSLPGIVSDGAIELAGSAFGIIKEPGHLIKGENIKAGDQLVLIESSGPHANGISLIREIAKLIPGGYQAKLASGRTFGEAALEPTIIYWQLVKALQQAGIKLHYLSNITGHGWRKIMRATAELSYIIEVVPPAPEIFDFIKEHSGNSEAEMYANFNMGAGYAIYLPPTEVESVIQIAKSLKLMAWDAGHVEKGPRQVIIKPKNITFSSQSLEMR